MDDIDLDLPNELIDGVAFYEEVAPATPDEDDDTATIYTEWLTQFEEGQP